MARNNEDLPSDEPDGEAEQHARIERGNRGRQLLLAGLLVVSAGLLAAWFSRERIARNFIASELEKAGLPATFRVVSIGPARQVIADVAIGNPAHPDLTVERIEVVTAGWLGFPGLGRITLVRPRLVGIVRNGRVSFGSLDKVLYGGNSAEPFRLPDYDIGLSDARAKIDGDQGPFDVRLSGAGRLRGGFAGKLAASAPVLAVGGCRASGAALSGKIAVLAERPQFAGPLRATDLQCANGLRAGPFELAIDASTNPALDAVEAMLRLRGGALALGSQRLAGSAGTARLTWRDRALTARYELTGTGLLSGPAKARRIALEGMVRAGPSFARVESEGTISGEALTPGSDIDSALTGALRAGEGSLAVPLLAQLRSALRRETPASTLAGNYILRSDGGRTSLIVPRLDWRGGSGAVLLALSRLQVSSSAGASPRISGAFATGGAGMPRVSGKIETGVDGVSLRSRMARYSAGTASVALPQFTLLRTPAGILGFAGEARLSGPLPGGAAEGLVLPVSGTWSQAAGVSLWRHCTDVRFDRLRLANLTLAARGLRLCPPAGGAIVRSDRAGTRIAAGSPSLALEGTLGQTPIHIASGPVGFAIPGIVKARALDITLGTGPSASHFAISNLDARIGKDVAGSFAGATVQLASVPLDLIDTAGQWRYANGTLAIAKGAFRLLDRSAPGEARFQPLAARDAILTLADNRIVADALLREPASDRAVMRAHIVHDLGSGIGNADLAIDDLHFDKGLQPDTLTRLALGVVANVEGSVKGSGRIDWTPDAVTSSGRFGTDSLDLAAAFGPVQGLSGTVVFTDLLGLVTAPDQRLRLLSVNPGIEARDGEISFELRPGKVVVIGGGRWPFLGGTLTLEPATMKLGVAETRRYTLVMDGLDAARLVEQMDLKNLAVTGIFDGRLPLVFDETGGRIEGGLLHSRLPGGNVSYVGALSYKDLSPMANFAFDALKSIDYRDMSVGLEGSLGGEIVTRLRFAGVSQGKSARSNFLTRQVARLPIQFNVNIRAPFFQLVGSFRSLWDTRYIRDPRELGLVGADGKPLGPLPAPVGSVQPPAIGNKP